MLRRLALVRTDVSEELSASIIRVTRISELEATLAPLPFKFGISLSSLVIYKPTPLPATPTSLCILYLVFHSRIIFLRSARLLPVTFTCDVDLSSVTLVTLMMELLRSSETSVSSKATGRNISEDGILHRHRRENVQSYIALTDCAP
jgi:hypothetical protein